MALEALEVRMAGELVGELSESANGLWSFAYVEGKVGGAVDAAPVSLALPRRQRVHVGDRVRAVFSNLLPEGEIRRRLAQSLGISERNDFALLARLAGDCHGALSLRRRDEPATGDRPPRVLGDGELRNALAVLPVHPLLAEADGLRVTLPGEFDKLPVLVREGQVHLSFTEPPTTHILKPARPGLRESVQNEAYVMALASAAGLPVAPCEMLQGQVTALCVRRIDREVDGAGAVVALGMEDFCQIAGLQAHEKYTREGGLGLLDIVRIVRDSSSQPAVDLRSILRWAIFSFLVGFGAAHCKQIALVYGARAPRLAPFYGLWSTHVYPGMNFRMGFPIGGEDRPDWLTAGRWRELAVAAGIRPAMLTEELREAAQSLPRLAADEERAFQARYGVANIVGQIRALIDQRARQVLVSLEAERAAAG